MKPPAEDGNIMELLIGCAGLAVLGLIALWVVSLYNGLVRARNAYKNAFAQIDVQLTRRHDLIPNLVETAKGYMKHERETLEAVITARSRRGRPPRPPRRPTPATRRAMAQLAGAESVLTAALGRLFALAEAYPDLQGQPEHDAAVGGADLHREPGRVRPAGLQRRGDGLQQQARGRSRPT